MARTGHLSAPIHALGALLLAAFLARPAAAQPQGPQAEDAAYGREHAVTSLRHASGRQAVFFTGNDGTAGMLHSGSGKRRVLRQLEGLRAADIAARPGGTDIAVVESDGIAVHRVEVIGQRGSRFAKQFPDTVLSISYSPQGTYLFITTAGVHGAYVLDAETGLLVHHITDVSGRITLLHAEEKSAIIYTSSGRLWFYNLTKMEAFSPSLDTLPDLEQPRIFGAGKLRNRFLGGVQNGTVCVVDVRTGKAIFRADAPSPLLVDGGADALYYIAESALMAVPGDALARRLEDGSAPVPPAELCSFREPDAGLTAAAYMGSLAILGAEDGSLYRLDVPASTAGAQELTAYPAGERAPLADAATDGRRLYLLTPDAILTASPGDARPAYLCGNPAAQTNLTLDGKNAILWSAGTEQPVQLLPLEPGGTPHTLFTPDGSLKRLRAGGGRLLYVEEGESCTVGLYDMGTGRRTALYEGYAVEDAVLAQNGTVYIAKASTGTADSPLVAVNIRTSESVLMDVDGIYAFSLCYDGGTLYGATVRSGPDGDATEIFSYRKGAAGVVLRYNGGDARALASLSGGTLYTSLGGNQLYALDLAAGTTAAYGRPDAPPRKILPVGTALAVLLADGGIAWYEGPSREPKETRYLLPRPDGGWEFR